MEGLSGFELINENTYLLNTHCVIQWPSLRSIELCDRIFVEQMLFLHVKIAGAFPPFL